MAHLRCPYHSLEGTKSSASLRSGFGKAPRWAPCASHRLRHPPTPPPLPRAALASCPLALLLSVRCAGVFVVPSAIDHATATVIACACPGCTGCKQQACESAPGPSAASGGNASAGWAALSRCPGGAALPHWNGFYSPQTPNTISLGAKCSVRRSQGHTFPTCAVQRGRPSEWLLHLPLRWGRPAERQTPGGAVRHELAPPPVAAQHLARLLMAF